MSLLDRVRACTDHDRRRFVPLAIDGEAWGWLLPEFADLLAAYAAFEPFEDGLALVSTAPSTAARSDVLDLVLRDLRARGALHDPWREERYPVKRRWEDATVVEVERSAVAQLGMPAFGVHLNGYVRTAEGVKLWVARRSDTKETYPGKLDHIAAGGQPVGLGRDENMVKECHEEAGIPADLATSMRRTGALAFQYDVPHGLRDDTIFTYELELPGDFGPVNRDGEVASFELLPISEVTRRLGETDDFKRNDAVVILDFLWRHDLLDRSDPELERLVAALAPLRVTTRT